MKRAVDICASLAALVLLLPLMVVVALVIWLNDRGPIFFAQERVGYHGRVFRCLKFRTMCTDAEARLQHVLKTDEKAKSEWQKVQKLFDDPRITPVGHFLRLTSIDELPQLINILLGDMTIVGPRPIVLAETSRYGRYLSHYLAVKPGLTGLWQTNGRNSVSYRRRVAMDVKYARRAAFGTDVWIMLKTVPAVLDAEGH